MCSLGEFCSLALNFLFAAFVAWSVVYSRWRVQRPKLLCGWLKTAAYFLRLISRRLFSPPALSPLSAVDVSFAPPPPFYSTLGLAEPPVLTDGFVAPVPLRGMAVAVRPQGRGRLGHRCHRGRLEAHAGRKVSRLWALVTKLTFFAPLFGASQLTVQFVLWVFEF